MILFLTPECLICELVTAAVQALAVKHALPLDIQGEAPDVPAYPALLYQGRLYIGEGIPLELKQQLEGESCPHD